jgi:hypothetical protein
VRLKSPFIKQRGLKDPLKSDANLRPNAASSETAWMPKPLYQIKMPRISQLLLHAIGQTAIANFESGSLEIFAQDTHMVDDSGAIRSRTYVDSESLRFRVRHRALKYNTAFGSVWIRTTVIRVTDGSCGTQERLQSITSFSSYPLAAKKRHLILSGV